MTIGEYIDYYKQNGYIKEMRKRAGHAPIMTSSLNDRWSISHSLTD